MPELHDISDEKLNEYIGIWNRLIERLVRIDVTVTMDYNATRHFLCGEPYQYTLTFGEEKRAITFGQAMRVLAWMGYSAKRRKELHIVDEYIPYTYSFEGKHG